MTDIVLTNVVLTNIALSVIAITNAVFISISLTDIVSLDTVWFGIRKRRERVFWKERRKMLQIILIAVIILAVIGSVDICILWGMLMKNYEKTWIGEEEAE